MKVGLEGAGFSTDNVKVYVEDDKGNALHISAYEALELLELLQNNAEMLRSVRDEEKKKKGKRRP